MNLELGFECDSHWISIYHFWEFLSLWTESELASVSRCSQLWLILCLWHLRGNIFLGVASLFLCLWVWASEEDQWSSGPVRSTSPLGLVTAPPPAPCQGCPAHWCHRIRTGSPSKHHHYPDTFLQSSTCSILEVVAIQKLCCRRKEFGNALLTLKGLVEHYIQLKLLHQGEKARPTRFTH